MRVLHRRAGREPHLPGAGPFAVLGLPAAAGLTDDDVRSAWRRVATATHPDRADGGDPARFAEAAAAYTLLRTGFGRGEALADLAGSGPARRLPRAGRAAGAAGRPRTLRLPSHAGWLAGQRLWSRARRGRPLRLALRACLAAAAGAVSVLAVGARPATPALITGALTWLLLTGRHDLAPPA